MTTETGDLSHLPRGFHEALFGLKPAVQPAPAADDILANMRRILDDIERSRRVLLVPPGDVDRVSRAVADAGVGHLVQVVGSRWLHLDPGEALLLPPGSGDWLEPFVAGRSGGDGLHDPHRARRVGTAPVAHGGRPREAAPEDDPLTVGGAATLTLADGDAGPDGVLPPGDVDPAVLVEDAGDKADGHGATSPQS